MPFEKEYSARLLSHYAFYLKPIISERLSLTSCLYRMDLMLLKREYSSLSLFVFYFF